MDRDLRMGSVAVVLADARPAAIGRVVGWCEDSRELVLRDASGRHVCVERDRVRPLPAPGAAPERSARVAGAGERPGIAETRLAKRVSA